MVICVTRMFDVLSPTFDVQPSEFDVILTTSNVIAIAFDSILLEAYSISVEADSNFVDKASGKIEADSADVAAVCFRQQVLLLNGDKHHQGFPCLSEPGGRHAVFVGKRCDKNQRGHDSH